MKMITPRSSCFILAFFILCTNFSALPIFAADTLLSEITDLAIRGQVKGSTCGIGTSCDDLKFNLDTSCEIGDSYYIYGKKFQFHYNDFSNVVRIDNTDPTVLNGVTAGSLHDFLGLLPVTQYKMGTYCTSYSYLNEHQKGVCILHPFGFTYQYRAGEYIVAFNFSSNGYNKDIHPERYYIFKEKKEE